MKKDVIIGVVICENWGIVRLSKNRFAIETCKKPEEWPGGNTREGRTGGKIRESKGGGNTRTVIHGIEGEGEEGGSCLKRMGIRMVLNIQGYPYQPKTKNRS